MVFRAVTQCARGDTKLHLPYRSGALPRARRDKGLGRCKVPRRGKTPGAPL